ncbi:receptor-like protein kinase precursor [Iris pallida]|uniref:Receptor-like protein kinase n=1 Tax=Iris pallida TaxID=29817 RepID=A0AAX6DTB0_IRIPA|nr:receptor-like protein kinase precursor [Iris pallida]
MVMAPPPLLLLFFFFLFFSVPATSKTLPSDVAALRAFKDSISPSSINPWSCLASWNFASDPCRPETPSHFTCGLVCSPAGRVVSITLDPAGYSGRLDPPARSLAPLSLLAHLDLFDNSFHGPVPDLSSLRSLQTLVLASNSFSGALPPRLLPSSLQTLDLSRNSLTGPIPAGLALPNLATLDLSFNRLSGPLPTSLPPNLVALSLRGNSIAGSLARPTFERLTRLEIVELGANRLEGKLEAWFFLLPSLQQVDLANNSLTALEARRPPGGAAGSGGQLVAVDLSFNRIAGALPAELAEYPALAALSARGNRLTGQIPWQYRWSKKGAPFRRLFLDGNFLNGKVPDGFLAPEGEMAGSFGDNCLESCPASVPLCSPVQKPDWLCKQVYRLGQRTRRPSPTPGMQ